MKTTLILAAALLTSCALTPQQKEQGLNLGLRIIEAKTKISPEDAALIRDGKAIMAPAPTGK